MSEISLSMKVRGSDLLTIFNEAGDPVYRTMDILNILELRPSEVLVPLDEIADAHGNAEMVFCDEETLRALMLKSQKTREKEALSAWLENVAHPLRDGVRRYNRAVQVQMVNPEGRGS